MKKLYLSIFLCLIYFSTEGQIISSGNTNATQKNDHQKIKAQKAEEDITIDGEATEIVWKEVQWHPMDQLWLGSPVSEEDFNGQFKVAWDEKYLYLLVEIKDNVLYDQYEDPLTLWWDDDCVEVFIDEDNSGGDHQYNYNAFAYHISLDYDVVDMDTKKKGRLYNDHLLVKRKTEGNTTLWEMAILLYDDQYKDGEDNSPVKLSEGKKIGFALAYCDNDESKERENFIGSVYVPGEDKNRGWIDANIFGTLVLYE